MGKSGQLHAPAVLYPGERTTGTHWIGGSLGLGAGLDTEAGERILYLAGNATPVLQLTELPHLLLDGQYKNYSKMRLHLHNPPLAMRKTDFT
jgi:hypothetical protein